jgi:hypothetical protein
MNYSRSRSTHRLAAVRGALAAGVGASAFLLSPTPALGQALPGEPGAAPVLTLPLGPAPLGASSAPPVPADAPAPPPPATAAKGNSVSGFVDLNAYPYLSNVKSDSVFTLNLGAKLPLGFSYFSLLNVMNQSSESPFGDTNGYYTEQNLRFQPFTVVPVDLTVQYNLRSGDDNDRLRFGLRWLIDKTPYLGDPLKVISLSYSINFHVLQVDDEDNYVWQMEHVARLDTPYLDRRVYVAGFADHTFNQGIDGIPDNPVVLEVQGGVRLIDELYAIAEYRVNQYRRNEESNLGVGAEYVIKW